jgi:hypothetical protein
MSAPPDDNDKTNAQLTAKLDGTWRVDSSYNEKKWNENILKGESHEWFEFLKIKKDSFFLEDHEWWPPHAETDGKEYFAADFTNYILGTYHIRKDSLILDGYYTDYHYSTKVDRMYRYNPVFRFTLNSDTLELSEYSFLRQKMIRRK